MLQSTDRARIKTASKRRSPTYSFKNHITNVYKRRLFCTNSIVLSVYLVKDDLDFQDGNETAAQGKSGKLKPFSCP